MIYARLYAGMGNQMFQYAFCKSLSEKTGQDIEFDISYGTDFCGVEVEGNFVLKDFVLDHQRFRLITDKKKFYKEAGFRMRLAEFLDIYPRAIRKVTKSKYIFRFFENLNAKILGKYGFYTNFDCFVETIIKPRKNYYVSGMFTCEKYFSEIEAIIKSEYTPNCNKLENNNYLDEIRNTNAVCVHIRKGNDYIKNPSLNVCSMDYYVKAMQMLQTKLENPVFYIFSNNLEWCREQLQSEKYQMKFVDVNDSTKPVQDLELMIACKHFILSNSTMSWWAQYLSTYKEKIVISPSVWSKGKIEQLTDLINPSWIFVEA